MMKSRVINFIVLFYFLFYLFAGNLIAQKSQKEDSLWKLYNNSKGSEKSVLTLIQLSKICYDRDKNLSEKLAKKAVIDAKIYDNKKLSAEAELRLANVFFDAGKYEESYYIADKLLQNESEIQDNLISADICKLIGRRYHFRGEYPKALEYYLKGLTYVEKTNNIELMSQVNNSIGGIYFNQADFKNAYKYYHRSQELNFHAKNFIGVATGYVNQACVYISEKKLKEGKVQLDSAYYYYDLEKYDLGKALVYANLSDIYMLNGQLDSALTYVLISYKEIKKSNNLYTLAALTTSIADIYFKLNNYNKAIEFIDESMNYANQTKQSHNLSAALLQKSKILEKAGKTEEAFAIYKEYKAYCDTIINAGNIKKQAEDALKYDYNKQEYQKKLEQTERDTKQRFILNSTIIGILLLVIILFLGARSYRRNQKNSRIIASQKAEVEMQHVLLKERNQEVLDSINYAKRIQEAILPPVELIKKYLPNSFVLYKPKAIVAGDFYWMEVIGDTVFIAAADCTGHGVPGAMVSVVCSNALNRSVKEFKLMQPGLILDKTRELVLETFEKSSSDVKDGMDISLLSFNKKTKQISWSGANNPLWYIYNSELSEIKATKQPIGKTDHPTPFITHQLESKENTTFYLFTDGFADQFGGPNGKKYKYKQFSELLIKINGLPLNEQSSVIKKSFEEWKGSLEQIDDLCVIGINL